MRIYAVIYRIGYKKRQQNDAKNVILLVFFPADPVEYSIHAHSIFL